MATLAAGTLLSAISLLVISCCPSVAGHEKEIECYKVKSGPPFDDPEKLSQLEACAVGNFKGEDGSEQLAKGKFSHEIFAKMLPCYVHCFFEIYDMASKDTGKPNWDKVEEFATKEMSQKFDQQHRDMIMNALRTCRDEANLAEVSSNSCDEKYGLYGMCVHKTWVEICKETAEAQ